MIDVQPTGPQALADALAARADTTTDCEAATVLAEARKRLQAISWNRFAAQTSKASARRALARRLRAHAGWRARL